MLDTQESVLSKTDRCDSCNAQAFVIVRLMEGELFFCGHHFSKHEEALNKVAYEIIDERNSINSKNQSSA